MASTVTPHADMAPCPRVDVFIDAADLDAATVEITVRQISLAGDIEVRNMRRVSSVGGFADTDYEPPLGIPITYKVQQWDADGVELTHLLELSTQVDIADGFVVLSDPLDPAASVMVEGSDDFGGELRRSRPTRVYRAGARTVAMSALRGLLEDVPLHCTTRTLEDADLLDDVLGRAVFSVRLMPSGGRLPPISYVVAPSPVQLPMDVQYGGEWIRWGVVGQEVSRPEIDILVAVINYGLFEAYMDSLPDNSYGAAAAIWSTYLDAVVSPPAVA